MIILSIHTYNVYTTFNNQIHCERGTLSENMIKMQLNVSYVWQSGAHQF